MNNEFVSNVAFLLWVKKGTSHLSSDQNYFAANDVLLRQKICNFNVP